MAAGTRLAPKQAPSSPDATAPLRGSFIARAPALPAVRLCHGPRSHDQRRPPLPLLRLLACSETRLAYLSVQVRPCRPDRGARAYADPRIGRGWGQLRRGLADFAVRPASPPPGAACGPD